MEREACTPWVVAARTIDEKCIRCLFERAHGRLECRSFTAGEQAGLVRASGLGPDHSGLLASCRSGPEWVTGRSGTAFRTRGTDEAAADHRLAAKPPERRIGLGERPLGLDELVGRGRPGRHEGRIVP